MKALSYLLEGGASTALNLGTGKGHSVREVVASVERISGQRVEVRETARRPGDPPVLVAEATRALQVLGWKPRHSSLEKIVETAWRWHSSQAKDMASASATCKQEIGERSRVVDSSKVL